MSVCAEGHCKNANWYLCVPYWLEAMWRRRCMCAQPLRMLFAQTNLFSGTGRQHKKYASGFCGLRLIHLLVCSSASYSGLCAHIIVSIGCSNNINCGTVPLTNTKYHCVLRAYGLDGKIQTKINIHSTYIWNNFIFRFNWMLSGMHDWVTIRLNGERYMICDNRTMTAW